ncbi:type II and III secretion system protein family protein [Halopseudomonas sp. SMJS2]|uniref:type II and III secretion system protein family protein n=1 Tax=Halopseudomonas sp. SMJS2 TaxID=3041098 RepID=UPI002453733A|nr:type II and III secretion system protein family protein [Halopseudomonas sp. SMJS2]WGK61777.1 type II and III secretion system protein family protein [Halopseudomonas sp. SMJS2]
MLIKNPQRILLALGALVTGLASPLALAQAATGCAALAQWPSTLEVRQGQHQQLQLPVPVTRIAVGNPEVGEARLLNRDSVLLLGKGPGVTTVSLWTRCASTPQQSMLFVEGEATAALARPLLADSAEAPLPSQVQTDIRFVEVNRTKLKEVGIRIFGTASNNFLFGSPGSSLVESVPVGGVSGVTPGAQVPLSGDGFNIVWGGGSSKFLGALNALENSGFAYTLSRPSLVALSGQSASFLAGGEFPVPIPSSGSDSLSIEYKEYGIRLNLTPTVIDRNRIHLKVAPEVSELDYNAGVVIAGIQVPALNIRRTDTSISLADGESFVISGLINSSSRSAVDKLPGLGDIPILGAFFRNSGMQREDKELLMIVTPRLVNPLAADAQLPALPGEQLRNYDPSVLEMLLFENGDFDRNNGLSW